MLINQGKLKLLNDYKIRFIFFSILLYSFGLQGQENTNAPTLESNLSFVLLENERWSYAANLSYNFNLNKEFDWNESAFSGTAIYSWISFLDFTGGMFINNVEQNIYLSSNEFRPTIGIRVYRPMNHRFVISNLSRIELRLLYYSDSDNDQVIRLRNLTHLFFSTNKKRMSDDKNLFVFAYVEWFYNFEDDVRERFFNLFKSKIGIGYRLNLNWHFSAGVIYQNTRENTAGPVQFPTDYKTNLAYEWRVTYVLQSTEYKLKKAD